MSGFSANMRDQARLATSSASPMMATYPAAIGEGHGLVGVAHGLGQSLLLRRAAVIGATDALGRGDLGRLQLGATADLALVNLAHPLMTPPRDPLRSLIFHAADRAVTRVLVGGETIWADGRPTRLDVAKAAGILAEAQARMLHDARGRDYRGRDGDEIAPLSLPLRPATPSLKRRLSGVAASRV